MPKTGSHGVHELIGIRWLSEVLLDQHLQTRPYASAAEQVTQNRAVELNEQFGALQQTRPTCRDSAAFPGVRLWLGLRKLLSLVWQARQPVVFGPRQLHELLPDIIDKRFHVDARRGGAKSRLELTLRNFNAGGVVFVDEEPLKLRKEIPVAAGRKARAALRHPTPVGLDCIYVLE